MLVGGKERERNGEVEYISCRIIQKLSMYIHQASSFLLSLYLYVLFLLFYNIMHMYMYIIHIYLHVHVCTLALFRGGRGLGTRLVCT